MIIFYCGNFYFSALIVSNHMLQIEFLLYKLNYMNKYYIYNLIKNKNKNKKIYINLLQLLSNSSSLQIKDIVNIVESIHKKKNDLYYFNKIILRKEENYDNSKRHAVLLYYSFEKYLFFLKTKINKYKTKILDYGCGHCTLGIEFSRLLGLDKSYGCDISNWNENFISQQKKNKNSHFEFKVIKENKRVSFENEFFDVIIISMVLHHVINYSFIFTELYRLLKPNGILIIREHDAVYESDKMLIDLQHYIYMYITYGDEVYIKNYDYYSHYRSVKEWNLILKKYKFKNIRHNYEYSNTKRPEIKLMRQCIIMCHK